MIKYNQQRIRKIKISLPFKSGNPNFADWVTYATEQFWIMVFSFSSFFTSIFESRNIIMWSNKNGTWVTWSGWQPLQLLLCVSLVTWWYIENRQSKLTKGAFVLENFLNVFRCRMKLLEWFLVNTHDTDLSFLFHIMG